MRADGAGAVAVSAAVDFATVRKGWVRRTFVVAVRLGGVLVLPTS